MQKKLRKYCKLEIGLAKINDQKVHQTDDDDLESNLVSIIEFFINFHTRFGPFNPEFFWCFFFKNNLGVSLLFYKALFFFSKFVLAIFF